MATIPAKLGRKGQRSRLTLTAFMRFIEKYDPGSYAKIPRIDFSVVERELVDRLPGFN
jgi:hypothetical protein